MTGWLLIFYMSGASQGGPAVAPFATKEACEQAIVTIKQSDLRITFSYGICVPQGGANPPPPRS